MKRLKVYYVMRVENGKENILSIVTNKKEAREFSANYLRLEKANHYLMWCNTRNLNPMLDSNWTKYMLNCVSQEEIDSFKLKQVHIKGKEVSEAFRVLCGFYPLGLQHEGPLEISMLMDALSVNWDSDFKNKFLLQAQLNPKMKGLIEIVKMQNNG